MALRRVLVRYKGVGACYPKKSLASLALFREPCRASADKHTPNKLKQSIKQPKAIESDGRR